MKKLSLFIASACMILGVGGAVAIGHADWFFNVDATPAVQSNMANVGEFPSIIRLRVDASGNLYINEKLADKSICYDQNGNVTPGVPGGSYTNKYALDDDYNVYIKDYQVTSAGSGVVYLPSEASNGTTTVPVTGLANGVVLPTGNAQPSTIYVPDGYTSLPDNCFGGSTPLTKDKSIDFYLPASLESLGYHAFFTAGIKQSGTQTMNLHYAGTPAQWDALIANSSNQWFGANTTPSWLFVSFADGSARRKYRVDSGGVITYTLA